MTTNLLAAAAAVTAALLLPGCGGDGAVAASPADPGTGAAMCAPGHPDCQDTVVDDGADEPGSGEASDEEHRAQARSLLGLREDELPAQTRVARRGEEQMMLTEDYVIGRDTVELDDAGDGTFVVTAVTVELTNGPETVRG
jgi:hypothetical protein